MKLVNQEFDPAIPLADLTDHPDNPRRGDDKAVADSVNANGFYGAILVQKSTGRVLAGHTRLRVARADGATSVPGIWLDVDDAQARRILLADNRTSDLAFYDDDTLFKLIAETLEEDGTLLGTGYDTTTYRLLLASDEAGDDGILGNVRQGLKPTEREADYEAADIRSIILPYAGDEYTRVVRMLGELRAARDLDTNAEVMLQLLVEATSAS
jgi:hypothetical protein